MESLNEYYKGLAEFNVMEASREEDDTTRKLNWAEAAYWAAEKNFQRALKERDDVFARIKELEAKKEGSK